MKKAVVFMATLTALTGQVSLANESSVESDLLVNAQRVSEDKSIIEDRVTVLFPEAPIEKNETEQKVEEKFIFPSMAFLSRFTDWRLTVGDVVLYQDNVKSLIDRHPSCRRIPASWSMDTGRVACRDTHKFLADGTEVIFSYANANEVLIGATFTFETELRAEMFSRSITETLKRTAPTYQVTFENGSKTTDSPLFKVSMYRGHDNYIVDIDSYYQDRIAQTEAYSKAKQQLIEFGSLVIGETRLEELPEVNQLPKTCTEVTSDKESMTREFYGVCFGFPYEAHMQLDFNEDTKILETAVLSPIGITSGAIVEDWLTKKYGYPEYCKKAKTGVVLQEIKDQKNTGRLRIMKMDGRRVSVFAGTCENPIIFSRDMRFIFDNQYLRDEEMLEDFEKRKEIADTTASHDEAFQTRSQELSGFFD